MERNKIVDGAADDLERNSELTAKDVRDVINSIPGLRRFVVAAALRALTARRCFWDRNAKAMQYEPDSNAQMKAVAFLAAYADGLPVQSTVNVNLDPTKAGGFSLGDALASSPALRDHLAKELQQAERKAIAA